MLITKHQSKSYIKEFSASSFYIGHIFSHIFTKIKSINIWYCCVIFAYIGIYHWFQLWVDALFGCRSNNKNCEKAFVVEMRLRRNDFRLEIFLTLYFQLGRLFVEVSSVFVDDIVKKQIDENDQHLGRLNEEKIGRKFRYESLQNPT